jgi:hypothetical protein
MRKDDKGIDEGDDKNQQQDIEKVLEFTFKKKF